MKILALDSSTSVVSIAFVEYQTSGEEKILFHFHQLQERTSSSVFFEGLQRALQQCGKPDRLVVGLGPGSYNGLRSSIAAAQGIATACNIKLVGLPSILSLETTCNSWIIGDARGGQHWLAAVSQKQELLKEPFLLATADIQNHLNQHPNFPLLSSQQLPHLPLVPIPTIKTPNAVILARLGKKAAPSIFLEPLYLKSPHVTGVLFKPRFK